MTRSPRAATYRAVLFDLGGVVLTSPFDAFNEYERADGLPDCWHERKSVQMSIP